MSDLAKRLSLYARKAPGTGQPSHPANVSPTYDSHPATADAAPQVTLAFGACGLTQIAHGVYRRQLRVPEASCGDKHISNYIPFSLSAILDLTYVQDKSPIHPEEILFLDTETTGLSRGAGTLPFLTGLAYFQNGVLCLEQIFLNDLSGEEAYLEYLTKLWSRFPYLVTFNGKSFDVPLLRNRLILNRMKSSTSAALHFDLLHICRRLFPRGTVPGYGQKIMETELLGMKRVDDLPGEAIPQIYFDYRKYGHDGGLERIFEHNRLDLIGMVFLFLEAVSVYERKDTAHTALRSGIARILTKNRREYEAITLLESTDISAHHYRDLVLLGTLYRRTEQWERAVAAFRAGAERFACEYSRLSLARILEFRLGRYGEALMEVEHLSQQVEETRAVELLARARLRIQKKLEKQRA
ncbi:MAG: ribonuclease H-like domain-containing protein [Spirochaetia bacterium]|nr:ribonuclease H-like domain-containing protein [Spirochaetia bacterium]